MIGKLFCSTPIVLDKIELAVNTVDQCFNLFLQASSLLYPKNPANAAAILMVTARPIILRSWTKHSPCSLSTHSAAMPPPLLIPGSLPVGRDLAGISKL